MSGIVNPESKVIIDEPENAKQKAANFWKKNKVAIIVSVGVTALATGLLLFFGQDLELGSGEAPFEAASE